MDKTYKQTKNSTQNTTKTTQDCEVQLTHYLKKVLCRWISIIERLHFVNTAVSQTTPLLGRS